MRSRGASLAPEAKSKLVPPALNPNPQCDSEFATVTRRRIEDYIWVIGELNLKAE